jgi:hypothetical protein
MEVVIIIVKRWNVLMALTHQTFISCHHRGNIVAKLCEFSLTTTRIQKIKVDGTFSSIHDLEKEIEMERDDDEEEMIKNSLLIN